MWKNWKCDVTWSLPPPPPVTKCHTFSDPLPPSGAWHTLWTAPFPLVLFLAWTLSFLAVIQGSLGSFLIGLGPRRSEVRGLLVGPPSVDLEYFPSSRVLSSPLLLAYIRRHELIHILATCRGHDRLNSRQLLLVDYIKLACDLPRVAL